MAISIQPLSPTIGGEVDGADLTKPLTPENVAAIEAGMDKYAVLVFHNQDFTDEQQKAFTRNFGELEVPSNVSNIQKAEARRIDGTMADVSNLDQDHKPLAKDDRIRMFGLGNRLWHSDSSFPQNTLYSRAASSLRKAGTRNLPICAPPTMRSTLKPKQKSRIWSANILYSTPAASSDSRG